MSNPSKAANIVKTRSVAAYSWPEAAKPPKLSADEAHVWAIPLNNDLSASQKSLACLSADERRRAEQFQLEAPRHRFIRARVALRSLLGEYLGAPAAQISLEYAARGKPRLLDFDDGGLRFNLAHTSSLALVAVTRGCDIGVDVEQIRAVSHLEALARRYFHPSETNGILNSPPDMRHEAFLRCWTAKEAVVKAVGSGLTDSLAGFCVPDADKGGTWIELPAFGNGDSSRCWLERLTPSGGAIGAVAFVGEQRRVSCFTLKDANP
jgi:4'-phosphopantetheinyl transferase